MRGLELDDAARRGVERRRSSVLEYQEASEEVGFKGTMTLVGCGLIWLVLLLLLASYWYPPIRWLIAGLLVVFLGLQFLHSSFPKRRSESISAALIQEAMPGRGKLFRMRRY